MSVDGDVGKAMAGTLSKIILGGEKTADNRGEYLSLCRGGFPVNSAFFDFLKAVPFRFYPGKGSGGARPDDAKAAAKWDARQKENEQLMTRAKNAAEFAALVNGIPSYKGDWLTQESRIDTFYRDTWLKFIEVPTAEFSPATQAAYEKARKDLGYQDTADAAAVKKLNAEAEKLDKQAADESDVLKQMALQEAAEKVRGKAAEITNRPQTVYAKYAKYRNAYQSALAALNKQMIDDPSDSAQIMMLQNGVKNARDDWQMLGDQLKYESAKAIVTQVDDTNLNQSVQNLKNRYDAVVALNSDSSANPFAPVGVIPSNFFGEATSWSRLNFSGAQLEDTSSYDHSVGSSGTGAGLFWRSDGGRTETTTTLTTSMSQKMNVTFEYCRVALDRSAWFDTGLLCSQMWKWADKDLTAVLSDGDNTDTSKTYSLPMFATDMILARNVTVSIAMSQSEASSFEQTTVKSHRSGFWIFSTSSSSTHEEKRSTYKYESGVATLTIPGAQIVGFVCDVLPKSPNPAF